MGAAFGICRKMNEERTVQVNFAAWFDSSSSGMFHQLMSFAAVEVDTRLGVFSDPLRTQVLALLAREQLCTCHIVEETGAKQTTVSHHLKVLRQAGLVDSEPCGRFTYYRLVPEVLEELTRHLGELADAARATNEVRRPC